MEEVTRRQLGVSPSAIHRASAASADAAKRRTRPEGLARRRDLHQSRDANQVVGGSHQITRQASSLQTQEPGAAEATHGLHPAKDLLNGLFTNDKFCWSRPARLHLKWWRRAYRDR